MRTVDAKPVTEEQIKCVRDLAEAACNLLVLGRLRTIHGSTISCDKSRPEKSVATMAPPRSISDTGTGGRIRRGEGVGFAG